jgi:hypothetical protein
MNDDPCRKLPMRVTANVMAGHLRPGEPVVVLVAKGIGSTQPYEFRDRDGRSYLMGWDLKADGHVLRVPWHLWMGNGARLANAMMDQRRLAFAMVVLVELPEVVAKVGGDDVGKNDVLHPSTLVDLLKGGAVRLKTAAHLLNVTEEGLRAELARPDCPAVLSTGGWVRVKISAL